jgi:predicted nucleic acid-binding protein
MLTIDASVWVAAADRRDHFHDPSRRFLLEIVSRPLQIVLPSIVRIEIACALSRRRRDAAAGVRLADALLLNSNITIVPLNVPFIDRTIQTGTQLFLRGADAQYFTVAELHQTQLISWDGELIKRAGALTPTVWLTQHI